MNIKRIDISSDILFCLLDGKIHTANEIADKLNIHKNTVFRHIQMLSLNYPIETFRGGDKKGGIRINLNHTYQGRLLKNEELQLINQALNLLQKSSDEYANNQCLKKLIDSYSLPQVKENCL